MVQASLSETLPAAGIVLAGGMSQRMGQDKARIAFAGEPLIVRVCRHLRLITSDVRVIGGDVELGDLTGCPWHPDMQPGQGPLAGLQTAWQVVDAEWIVLAACDMPFVSPRLVLELWHRRADADAVVFVDADGPQPMHGLYRRTAAPAVDRLLAAGERRLHKLLAAVETRRVPCDEVRPDLLERLSCFNINRPDDLKRALELLPRGMDE